jgi:epoxyqueuosine reductase
VNAPALTAELRRRATEEGFDALAVAGAGRLDRDVAALERWLEDGRQAGMAWMERAPGRRGDPTELLPGCRSVVIVAVDYAPVPPSDDGPARPGRVAAYARGRDYHKVMSKPLRRLAAWLDGAAASTSRVFVDTGPVLERAWAERAGLGWIGKNANLISRTRGSWLLLGEVLTTAELEPDDGPHADFCGSCRACIDACPTGAIVEDGVVDGNRCISYWTIEHRGEIPEGRRDGIGEWIFGCDVCQDVCPWNLKFAGSGGSVLFERRDELEGLDPRAILRSDEAGFRETYSGTPLMRARWDGMRRNACVVMGNLGRSEYLEALEDALDDADPTVRTTAAWAIGRIRRRDSR